MTRRIKVRVDMDQNGPNWQYGIAPDDPSSGPYVKPGDRIDLPHGPQSTIEFRLQGKSGKRLDSQSVEPIWVKEESCPDGPGDGGGQIEILSCTDDRLQIRDLNSKETELHYRLNFVDEQGNPHFWDPIIRNGGGGP